MELHTGGMLSGSRVLDAIDFFQEQDFEIVETVYDPPRQFGRQLKISRFEDLIDLSHDVHLFIRKN